MAHLNSSQERKPISERIHSFLYESRKIWPIVFVTLAVFLAATTAFVIYNEGKIKKAIAQVIEIEEDILSDSFNTLGSDYEATLAKLENISKKNIRWASAKAGLLLSSLYRNTGDFSMGIEVLSNLHLKKASYMAPSILYNLAVMAEESGDKSLALNTFRTCDEAYEKSFPEAARVVFAIARLEEEQGNTELAKQEFQRIIDLWPQDNYSLLAQTRLLAMSEK